MGATPELHTEPKPETPVEGGRDEVVSKESQVSQSNPPDQPPGGKEEKPPAVKKTKKRASIILSSILILILLCGIIILIFVSRPKKVEVAPSPTPKKTITITPAPTEPEATTSAAPIKPPILWARYPSGGNLEEYGIAFMYPKDWIVNYRRHNDPLAPSTPYVRIEFDFLPPQTAPLPTPGDWMGWGSMNIDVYPRISPIDAWISTYLPELIDKSTHDLNTRIKSRAIYTLTPDEGIELPAQYVVLGSKHSYRISFPREGTEESTRRIKKEIWPKLVLQ